MNFLHVLPSFALGGREMRVVELCAMLGPGTRHEIIALDGRTECLERARARADVRHVPFAVRGSLLRRVRTMRELLRARRPNLLLTYNWGAIEWLVAARLERLHAVVHHEDGFGLDEVERRFKRRAWGRRILLSSARAVIVPSRTLYEIGLREWRQPEDRLWYMPNGVDVSSFLPWSKPPGRQEIVFGCVGRITAEKSQALAVEAFALSECFSRARLRIVGSGIELGRVRARAAGLGAAERIDFVGQVEDMAPEYRAIDALVIPSRTEQMPIALLEAMACGLPVAATDVGDVAYVLGEKNRALVVPPGDPVALAGVLDRLARDAELRAGLGAENRARVEKEFEIGVCYRRYLELYSRVAVEA